MTVPSDTFCTYITYHPSGFWYAGKSSLRRVNSGYQGSGPRLLCAMLHPGFEPYTWQTQVLATYPTETIAFLAEERLVPLEVLSSPWCLNSIPGGGKRFYGSPYARLLKKTKPNVQAKTKPIKVTTKTLTVAELLGKKP